MKQILLLSVAILLMAATTQAADPNDPSEYREIINKRCTLCHTQERIEAAIRDGRDMNQIMIKMMRMGATLTEREQKVLGTFWGSPLKE